MNHLIHSLMTHRFFRLLLAAALMAGLVSTPYPHTIALGTTWYVSPTGDDGDSCTSPAAACLTITAAISKAAPGDIILIAAGTYVENITIFKSLTLQGAGANVSIIDGGGIGPVVSIGSESNPIDATLAGLTFQHGQGGLGGGISNRGNPGLVTISNSTIVNNTASSGGGGIFSQGNLKLNNVIISSNTNTGQQRGGGMLVLGTADLVGVTLTTNTAQSGGGAVGNGGTMTITGSTIGAANQAAQGGGGIYNFSTTGSSPHLTLNATTIAGNQANGPGGGLYNEGGQVIASGSVITGNQSAGGGGGIYNTNFQPFIGQLLLTGSTVENNESSSSNGGAIDNEATANVIGATIINNRALLAGGGIYNGAAAQLTASSTSIRDNTAQTSPGGGLFNLGTATLTRATVDDNRAATGGGLYNVSSGQLTVQTSVIIRNAAETSGGGGINNQGTLTLMQSSIVSNTSEGVQGGGLYNQLSAQLTNVTISNNTSPDVSDSGGAIYNNGGTLAARHATISFNRAPGVVNVNGGSVTLINSIAATSTLSTGGSGANCSGPITALGNNIDSGNTCGFGSPGSFINTDPLLGPLQNNGGSTLSRFLFASSPAVDTASLAQCASVDQRGISRPQGDGCDIGAYEIVGFTNVTPVGILPSQCVTSTMTVNSSLIIGSLHVGVNLTFFPRGDLRINLRAPYGAPVNLLGDTGGSGQNLDVLWDDDAATVITSTNHSIAFPYYENVHRPALPLTPLFGHSVGGDWQLEICNLGPSTGTLNRWTLFLPDVGTPKTYLPIIRRG